MKGFLLLTILFFVIPSLSKAGDTIKIMPVGNSITAGEHYGYPRLEDRTGYRKPLYNMLIKAGYIVDFVGSQNHGKRTKSDPVWYDWNCEAYPGWTVPAIAEKVKKALPIYKPDILLVHVGTNGNDWKQKPRQVMDMLDMINAYVVKNNHPIKVFLCKIIKRFYLEESDPISQFNKEVSELVAQRTNDKLKIIMVDMEKGAGLEYNDLLPDSVSKPPYEGGDMWGRRYPDVSYDKYHPNDKGNTKMAVKFYKELVKVLPAPHPIEK